MSRGIVLYLFYVYANGKHRLLGPLTKASTVVAQSVINKWESDCSRRRLIDWLDSAQQIVYVLSNCEQCFRGSFALILIASGHLPEMDREFLCLAFPTFYRFSRSVCLLVVKLKFQAVLVRQIFDHLLRTDEGARGDAVPLNEMRFFFIGLVCIVQSGGNFNELENPACLSIQQHLLLS